MDAPGARPPTPPVDLSADAGHSTDDADGAPSPVSAIAALEGLRAAIMLLSRLPVGRGDTSPGARRWASGWFPVVGALLTGAGGAFGDLVAPALGSFLAAILAIALIAALTGALHEDGLADTADALGGARDRAQIFVILKDSRHGTYGVLALVVVVLVRVGALERINDISSVSLPASFPWLFALLVAGLLSRLALTWLLFALPYVTPAGRARNADVAHAGPAQIVLASALALVGVAALGTSAALPWIAIVAAAAATTLVTAVAGLIFLVRAGGITGDFLGATAQLTEAACLIAVALVGGSPT